MDNEELRKKRPPKLRRLIQVSALSVTWICMGSILVMVSLTGDMSTWHIPLTKLFKATLWTAMVLPCLYFLNSNFVGKISMGFAFRLVYPILAFVIVGLLLSLVIPDGPLVHGLAILLAVIGVKVAFKLFNDFHDKMRPNLKRFHHH